MLERLIIERAQLAYARESGLRIDDQQLDQAIGRIAANNKLSTTQFRAALEKARNRPSLWLHDDCHRSSHLKCCG